MSKKSWEASPAMWIAISVVAGVTTAVVAAALQKWWGLKLAQQKIITAKNFSPAQVQNQANLGKYRAVY